MSRKKAPSRLLTDAVREVRNTRSRFLSLLVLSALAVCFLAGLRATAPDMKETGDLYFDQQRLMDLRVVSTLGLTEEDVELLARQEGVEEAEGAYTIDAAVPLKDQEMIVKVHSFAEEGSNRPRLVEGRLPRKVGECLVEPLFLEKSGLSIGDTIRLDTGTGDFEDALARREFTIVGTADSPLYISVERGSSSLGTGAVSAFVLLPQAAFSLDYYTDAYLRAEGAEELLCYSEDYTELVNSLSDALEPLAEERSALRGESIREEAEQALADARRELSDGEAEVSQELSEGEAELTDARRELDDGWAEYYDGLNTFEQETADAQREIDDGEAELADALTELRDGEQEYQDALPELEDARREVADARQELADARAELDDGWAEYRKGYAKYEYGLAAYTEGMAQYEQGLAGVEQMRAGAQQARQGAAQAQQGAVQAQQGAAQAGAAAQQYAAQAQQAAAMGNLLLAQQLQAQAQQYEAQAQQLTAQAQQLQAQAAQALAQAEALEVQAVQVEAQLSAGLPRLQSSVLELNASLGLLTQAKRELDDGEAEYADGAARLADGEQELADGERELADARQELDEGWQEYRDGQAELADARETLERESEDGRAELADALTELQNGEAEYADGLADYEEGKAEAEQELADARKELEQARRDLDALEDCSWYLLGRGTNTGYASYEMDADRMGSLAAVFPLIFFLVAALVCLTTMTRMVEEQRITIGGMKALGYSKGAIAVKYVGYGFLASAAGGGPGAGGGADPAALDHLQRLGHPLHSGGDPVRLLPRYLPAGLRGRGGDGDPLRPGGLLLHPGSGAGGADAAQGTPHGQAHPAGADRPPVAAAVLQLQDHPAQPVPLSAPLLDDGGGHRRLRCPDRHRLRPAGLHFRRDGQAVRRDLPLYRPNRAGGPSDPRRAGGGDRDAGAVRAGERMAGEPLGDGLRRDGAVHGGLHGGGGAQPGGAGPLRLPAPPDGQRAGAPA